MNSCCKPDQPVTVPPKSDSRDSFIGNFEGRLVGQRWNSNNGIPFNITYYDSIMTFSIQKNGDSMLKASFYRPKLRDTVIEFRKPYVYKDSGALSSFNLNGLASFVQLRYVKDSLIISYWYYVDEPNPLVSKFYYRFGSKRKS